MASCCISYAAAVYQWFGVAKNCRNCSLIFCLFGTNSYHYPSASFYIGSPLGNGCISIYLVFHQFINIHRLRQVGIYIENDRTSHEKSLTITKIHFDNKEALLLV